jgi:hypothetical protein
MLGWIGPMLGVVGQKNGVCEDEMVCLNMCVICRSTGVSGIRSIALAQRIQNGCQDLEICQ